MDAKQLFQEASLNTNGVQYRFGSTHLKLIYKLLPVAFRTCDDLS